jgi:2-polyprenyl-6-methoxyphenol hydroxylase-like FAD-dependent oxidoreductase
MDTDVLIVGAGPTGLMLANQLVRRGVRTVIIDRHAGPARETRALGVQARTLEIYAQLGLAKRAIELGKIGTGANLWANGRWMARAPISDAGLHVTPYPYILVLGQDDNERIMGERLRGEGLSVQWNTELVDFEQKPDQVAATLLTADGSRRTLTTAWIAGCDGAHSAVRERSRIAFAGAPYEHVFYVADTEATGSMVPDEVNIYFWQDGFHLLFPMRGKDHWRVVGILPQELRGRDDVGFDAVVPSIRQEAGSGLAFRSCSWFSTYRIHHRRAVRFRDRRAFLLGDAAHIHSPVGAQGMNTGLQDAYNLGWKLALVVAGRADARILESYEAERVPVAERLLDTTDRAFRVVVSDGWLAGVFRTRVLARIGAFALGIKQIQAFAFRTVSQTGIHYRKGPLSVGSGLPESAPQAGDRFPWLKLQFAQGGPAEDSFARLDDTHFNLLAFGQPAPEAPHAFGDLLRAHAVPVDATNDAELDRVRIPRTSFYLIRPDGHVGLCGARIDAGTLTRYATGTLGLVEPRG